MTSLVHCVFILYLSSHEKEMMFFMIKDQKAGKAFNSTGLLQKSDVDQF